MQRWRHVRSVVECGARAVAGCQLTSTSNGHGYKGAGYRTEARLAAVSVAGTRRRISPPLVRPLLHRR
jgi:hypothetical protein